MTQQQYSIYRPSLNGNVSSMLHTRSAGHFVVSRSWKGDNLRKMFLELFWCVRGKLEFCCQEKRWVIQKNDIYFYLPGDRHEIRVCSDEAEYFWLTIDGPNLPEIISSFDIERASRCGGRCPVTLFKKLFQELRNCSRTSEFKAGATAYEILSIAFAGNVDDTEPELFEFRNYVEANFRDSNAGIESCAAQLGCHRSTLTRLVKRHYSISPLEYLNSFRIQEALLLLYDSKLSIKEIAGRCGFRDPNYFSKVIFRRFGKNPSEIRRY